MTTPRRSQLELQVRTASDAARRLAALNHGALIVLQRETGLQDLAETGTQLDADLSVPLLMTIFHPNTPLHDGGAIVQNNRLIAAGCVLPLTSHNVDDFRMGLRHRAGLGISEACDAIAIIISEERGTISVAHNGKLSLNLDPEALEHTVLDLYPPSLRNGAQGLWQNMLRPRR